MENVGGASVASVVTPDGTARTVAEDLAFPNGMAVTSDDTTLDAEGAVWAADVGNQHRVRVREGGQVLQTIDADRCCFACALGGPSGNTLYIVTAQFPNDFHTRTGQVLAVQVEVPSAA